MESDEDHSCEDSVEEDDDEVMAVYETDALKDTLFWQSGASDSSDEDDGVLTDEADSLHDMTQVSVNEFRFYQLEATKEGSFLISKERKNNHHGIQQPEEEEHFT